MTIKTPTLLLLAVCGIFLFAQDVFAQSYFMEGVFYSENLLAGEENVEIITTFNATTSIPSGTTIKVLFSQTQTGSTTDWCGAKGITNKKEELSDGVNSIDISKMGWSGPDFYYKIEMKTDSSTTTPELLAVSVDYGDTAPTAPDLGNFISGTLVSTNLLSGHGGVGFITEFKADMDIPANATATVQFSQDGVNWSNNTTGITNTKTMLSHGENNIDLSNLGWSGSDFYYKMHFKTATSTVTPSVSEVSVHYSGDPPPEAPTGHYFPQGTILSKNLVVNPMPEVALESFGYELLLPNLTSAWIQFSNDGSTFYSATGTEWGWSVLPESDRTSRDTALDLDALNWTADKLYYRVKFETGSTGTTPVLKNVRPYYAGAHRVYSPDMGFLTDGLVGHWTFDGRDMQWTNTGVEVRDRSGQGNHGSLEGGLNQDSVAIGQIGQALRFDGVSDYVDLGNPTSLKFGTGDFTFSTWVKTEQDCSGNKVYSGKYHDGSSVSIWLGCVDDTGEGRALFNIRSSAGGSSVGSGNSTTVISDGQWYLLTGVKEGNSVKIYVDGQLENSNTGNFGEGNFNEGNVQIGRFDVSTWYYADAVLDDARIYNRALSGAEIEQLYRRGSGRFYIIDEE